MEVKIVKKQSYNGSFVYMLYKGDSCEAVFNSEVDARKEFDRVVAVKPIPPETIASATIPD
jgi:hypothetical protein